jgi:hypothetical protein
MKKLTRDRVVPIISAKRLLADFREDRLRFLFLAKVRQQQEQPGKTFLTRIEQLIDEPGFQRKNEQLGSLLTHGEAAELSSVALLRAELDQQGPASKR